MCASIDVDTAELDREKVKSVIADSTHNPYERVTQSQGQQFFKRHQRTLQLIIHNFIDSMNTETLYVSMALLRVSRLRVSADPQVLNRLRVSADPQVLN